MQQFTFIAAKQNRKLNYEVPLRIYLSYLRVLLIGRMQPDTIVAVIKDTLIRMNLNLNRRSGQCYDNAGIKGRNT